MQTCLDPLNPTELQEFMDTWRSDQGFGGRNNEQFSALSFLLPVWNSGIDSETIWYRNDLVNYPWLSERCSSYQLEQVHLQLYHSVSSFCYLLFLHSFSTMNYRATPGKSTHYMYWEVYLFSTAAQVLLTKMIADKISNFKH